MLNGLLIDPFQKQIHPVETPNDINAWHDLLDCDTLDVVRVDRKTDIWVDDEGLLREPRYPFFSWLGYPEQLCGYGLILSHDGPESVSAAISLSQAWTCIQYENWEERLNPEKYFEQMTRIYLHSGTFGVGSIEIHICSICRQPYQGFGNNAQPVNDGRCCDRCNQGVVIPHRLKFGR